MAVCGVLVSGLDATVHPADQPAGLDAHESHASASLLGQFRGSVSAWLWMRTDLYLHNGVEMRPMTEWEKRAGTESHGAADDGHDELMDESSIVTLVPAAERDFRGVFGDIERATTTYKDMHGHDHNDPTQALPLFRLMTWIDPKFITGWTVGGAVIARDRSDVGTAKALDHLRRGLDENPKSIAIMTEIGQLLASRRKDFAGAIEVLDRAREVAFAAEKLLPDEKESLRDAYRWLGFALKGAGQSARLHDTMAEGLRVFPDDLVIARLLNPPPKVLTKKGQLEWLENVLADPHHGHEHEEHEHEH